MKKLLLIRHAKATHESGYIDNDRPLTDRGRTDAAFMAERVKANGLTPELIVASPALRTLNTADIFAEHLGVAAPQTNRDIYEVSAKTLLSVINSFTDDYNNIALVGHNPGITEILYKLTDAWQEMNTSGVALIQFNDADNWAEISAGTGKLISYDAPKF